MEYFGNINYATYPNSRDFYSVYINSGASTYHGDLGSVWPGLANGQLGFSQLRYSPVLFGIGATYRLPIGRSGNLQTKYKGLSIRAEVNTYRISGADSLSTEDTWRVNRRGLSFFAQNIDANVVAQVDLTRYKFRLSNQAGTRARITTYAIAGVGLTTNNPYVRYTDSTTDRLFNLRKVRTEGVKYSPVVLTIPMGIGVQLQFEGVPVVFGIEGSYRLSFTDYLDDVGGYYADPASFDNDIQRYLADPTGTHSAGDQRAGLDSNDGYVFYNFRLAYYFKNRTIGQLLGGR